MSALAHPTPPDSTAAQIAGFIQPYITRVLRKRARYRYVHPMVWSEGDAFRIEAPCCSRNVDPAGGVIDIALFRPGEDGRWQLYARDHTQGVWVLHAPGLALGEALEAVRTDVDRKFWP